GLRRVARDPGGRQRRGGGPESDEERGDGQRRAAPADPNTRAAPYVRVPAPARERRDHEPEGVSAGYAQAPRPAHRPILPQRRPPCLTAATSTSSASATRWSMCCATRAKGSC